MKRIFNILLLAIMTIIMACASVACFGDEGVKITDITVKGTGYSNGVLTLYQTKETTLTATTVPESEETITWTMADTSIATVDNGVVKGIGVGETKLSVSAGGFSKDITVNVKEYIPMTAISFAEETQEIATGVRKQLEYTVAPENATYKNVVFEVSPANEGVEVSSSGMIQVANDVEGGKEYTITARSYNETNVTATLKIIVESYELEDIKIVSNDFYTEIEKLTVPVDEPYRVLFQMAEPEKAFGKGEKIPTVWTSSDESVVKVNEKGRLTFHSQGTATITMEAMGITKTVEVTVTEPCGNFIDGYYMPERYLNAMATKTAPTALGWQTVLDFINGGTQADDFKKYVVAQKYEYFTGPSSWFAGGGYCVEMGGWDNVHSGLEDDDMEGGGMPNLYMWSKIKFGEDASKVRAYFEYRQTDATFKYKLRFSVMDLETKKITHISDWMTGEYKTDPNLAGGVSFVEADFPEEYRGKEVVLMLEYDDIDYTTDGILNGVESVNIEYFTVLNYNGQPIENTMWIIGDSIMTTDFSKTLSQDIADLTGHTLFRDTISGSTIAPASSIGIIDRIDSGYYEKNFGYFGAPDFILIQRGTNDCYWSSQNGNPLKMGDKNSTDKTETYGAIRYMIEYFQRLYPEAKIIMSTAIYRVDVDDAKIRTYNANLKEICNSYGVSVLDLYTETGFTANNSLQYLMDGIHPNTAGQAILKDLWVAEVNKLKAEN